MGIKVGFSELDNKFNVNIESAKGLKGDKGDKGDPGPKGDKGDPGTLVEKQYELIEEITLEEDITLFKRLNEPSGEPYNFSAIRVYVEAAPCPTASSTSQLILKCMTAQDVSNIYHQVNGGLNSVARATGFVARNDCGLVEYYAITSSSGDVVDNVKTKPRYGAIRPWVNIARLQISCYPSTVYIPAGTKITIYGIRG